MNSEEYNLRDFDLMYVEPYVYRLFKNSSNLFLMEVTCGSHGLWTVWIKLNHDEIKLYENEGNPGLEKTAKLFSFYCHHTDYQKRYVIVTT